MVDWSEVAVLISVIAILFTALRDFILPLIFYPRIVLEGKNDDDCVHDTLAQALGGLINSRWLRLRIKNVGILSTPVRNCYVKLLEIRDPKGIKISPFNPTLLIWVQYEKNIANLAKGEEHYIDFLVQNEGDKWISIPKIPLPNALMVNYPNIFGQMGIYTFCVGVYGDNVNGKKFTFKVSNEGVWNKLNFV